MSYADQVLVSYMRLRQFARYSIGRILGTVSNKDSKYLFFIDLAESKLYHRAELNAIIKVLVDKKVLKVGEWEQYVAKELELAVKEQQTHWPECTPAADGKSCVIDVKGAQKRCQEEGWPP